MKKNVSLYFCGALSVVVVSSLVAEEKTWWDRLFPRRTPQIISDNKPQAPRVDPPPEAVNLQDSFAKVAQAVKPAVVNISAVQINKVKKGQDPHEFFFGDPHEFLEKFFGGKQPSFPKEYRTEGTGSGVIIDPDGYILTNNHVVQDAAQLTVTLSGGESYKGRVIGSDPRTDLAVIRIKSSNPFPFVALGNSSEARIGDWVLAIGSPFGLEQTVTAGIISAIRQSLNIEGRSFRDLIQTDAAINRGNSGGPLVNLRGEVVGVNVAIFAPTGVFSGIGFAIPVNRAKAILKELIEKGYVERSWMGVEILDVDDIMVQQFGLKTKEGALINTVIPDSPADKAGLRRGDVVVEFNGKKIKKVAELQDIVSQTEPESTVDVKIIRNRTEKTVKLTTAVMPSQVSLGSSSGRDEKEDEEAPRSESWLGADWTGIGTTVRDRYKIPKKIKKGIVAIQIPADSLAADAGLVEGDVVRSINQKKLTNLDELLGLKEKLDPKEGLISISTAAAAGSTSATKAFLKKV